LTAPGFRLESLARDSLVWSMFNSKRQCFLYSHFQSIDLQTIQIPKKQLKAALFHNKHGISIVTKLKLGKQGIAIDFQLIVWIINMTMSAM
jgi:hypothetical protein